MNEFNLSFLPQIKAGTAGAGDVILKNVGESDFTSPFWHWFIVAITVFGFVYCIWLLVTQLRARTNKRVQRGVEGTSNK